jgi:hypothetical protein
LRKEICMRRSSIDREAERDENSGAPNLNGYSGYLS